MWPPQVLVELVHPAAQIPQRAHPGDAGWDLVAVSGATLAPGERALVGTGIRLGLPPGFAGFVHARSGRALRDGLTVVNAPGLIDSGYRGEVNVIVANTDREHMIVIEPGDRIAQLVIQRVEVPQFIEVSELPGTQRDTAGFGSSGMRHES